MTRDGRRPTLWAISDLHTGHTGNKPITESLHPSSPDDWLIVAGDVAERTDEIRWALDLLRKRFAKVIWVPGNHELWTTNRDPMQIFGKARYDYLVNMCDEMGIVTPEHPFPVWTEEGGPATIVPMFLLYDYSFLPQGAATKAEGLAIARERNVVGTDEFLLSSEPYATRDAWCRDRVAYTRKRLEDLDWMTPTVLVNHFPMVREPCDAMFYPEFALWCGTTATADWHTRYNAVCSVYGHLHIPRTTWYDGVRFEEVSVGYPREWRRRKPYRWLRQILPDPKYAPGYLNEFGGHFEITAGDARARREGAAAHQGQAVMTVTATLLSGVLPGGAQALAAAEMYADPPELAPLPEEEPLIAKSVAKRRNEFITVRYCARQALGELGVQPVPILKGEKGEPCWPDGIVGSLTHCEGYRGAAVGQTRRGALGGHRRRAARRAARRVCSTPSACRRSAPNCRRCPTALHWDRILFCAKEATYKAWFPLTQRWLGFEDAHITFDVDGTGASGGFESRILIDPAAVSGPPLQTLSGRWSVRDGLALTAIVL